MRRVSLWMQMSLDGYTEGPNGEFDWPIVNKELHTYFVDELRAMGAFLYGRKVYDGMVAFWPTADTDPSSTALQAEYARVWKPMPKIVFSRTLKHVEWNTTVVGENIMETDHEAETPTRRGPRTVRRCRHRIDLHAARLDR